MPRARHAFAIAKCVSSGVKMIATSPGSKAAAAFVRPTRPPRRHVATSRPPARSRRTRRRARAACARDRRHLGAVGAAHAQPAHLAAPPQVEHHGATTPVDLSESLAPWPVKPVVYSPVPSMRTPGGGMMLGGAAKEADDAQRAGDRLRAACVSHSHLRVLRSQLAARDASCEIRTAPAPWRAWTMPDVDWSKYAKRGTEARAQHVRRRPAARRVAAPAKRAPGRRRGVLHNSSIAAARPGPRTAVFHQAELVHIRWLLRRWSSAYRRSSTGASATPLELDPRAAATARRPRATAHRQFVDGRRLHAQAARARGRVLAAVGRRGGARGKAGARPRVRACGVQRRRRLRVAVDCLHAARRQGLQSGAKRNNHSSRAHRGAGAARAAADGADARRRDARLRADFAVRRPDAVVTPNGAHR